jgi:hypothetical protein
MDNNFDRAQADYDAAEPSEYDQFELMISNIENLETRVATKCLAVIMPYIGRFGYGVEDCTTPEVDGPYDLVLTWDGKEDEAAERLAEITQAVPEGVADFTLTKSPMTGVDVLQVTLKEGLR